MDWIKVEDQMPDKAGNYVVETLTTCMNIRRRLEAHLSITVDGKKTKKTWNVSNQIVKRWLKED